MYNTSVKRCPACTAACWDSHRHCPACGNDVSAAPTEPGDPYAGTTLVGKYHITELIGVGAMGRVYRADHLQLDAQVAVKLLNPEMAADAQTLKRFQTEARAASRLRHPNTIQVHDFGQSDAGVLFLVMEFLRGRNLAQIIADEPPLSPPRLVDLLGQALAALDEAHAAGVVHRDFKPENIFVETLRTGKEHVKVLDFGIAKLRGEADANLTSKRRRLRHARLHEPGADPRRGARRPLGRLRGRDRPVRGDRPGRGPLPAMGRSSTCSCRI